MPEDYDLAFRMLKHKLKVIRLKEVVHHWRDSETRVSRNEKQYFPIAYLPLKVHYFLELHWDKTKELIVWGAGKKGKLVAKELIKKKVPFTWMTNNDKKVGVDIYGVLLHTEKDQDLKKAQTLIAVSSPNEKVDVQRQLNEVELVNNVHYYWFF
jgi:UDP-N-acetylmuramoylalanine-D-glutamate ligase